MWFLANIDLIVFNCGHEDHIILHGSIIFVVVINQVILYGIIADISFILGHFIINHVIYNMEILYPKGSSSSVELPNAGGF